MAIYDFRAFWHDTGAYLGSMNRTSLWVTGLAGLILCGLSAFLPLAPVMGMTSLLAGFSLLLLAALGLALGGPCALARGTR